MGWRSMPNPGEIAIEVDSEVNILIRIFSTSSTYISKEKNLSNQALVNVSEILLF